MPDTQVIFLCLLPSPTSLFQYLKITRRIIFMSILVTRETHGYAPASNNKNRHR